MENEGPEGAPDDEWSDYGRDPRFKEGWWIGPVLVVTAVFWGWVAVRLALWLL